MSKKVKPGNDLDDAMAEALASVERRERQGDDSAADAADIEEVTEEEADDGEEREDTGPVREQLLRLAADFENFRKRSMREMQEARKFGSEKVLFGLLPVIDNLNRALAASDGDDSPIVQGLNMVMKQFADVLESFGVKGFDSLGQPFDPECHEAVGQAPGSDAPPGTIVEELLKGYHFYERLLRPAQVLVAAAVADSDSDSDSDSESGAGEEGSAS